MRVSLGLQMDNTASYLREASEKMLDAQRKVTSGKKITKPSDDPTIANRSMSLRAGINGIAQYKENTNLAKSSIDFTEGTVGSIETQLEQLQSAATSAANGVLSSDKKPALLAQIQNIRNSLLSLAGTKYLDKYVFSGTSTNTSPIVANPANPAVPPYIYKGDAGAINIRIQSNEMIQTNVTANQVFNLDGSAGAGVKDVFTTLQNLETAVNAGDNQTCSNLLADITGNLSHVSGIQSDLGARSARLADNTTALTDLNNKMTELLSNVEDVDLPSAIVDLQTQQNVYQAALAVTSKLMQRSLADYLS